MRLTAGSHPSATRKRGTRGRCCALGRPAREGTEETSSARRPNREREKGGSRLARFGSGGPPGHRATGKEVSSFFFFYKFVFQSHFKMNFEFKSNKTKTTPQIKSNATA
jgi:hypothetical protein